MRIIGIDLGVTAKHRAIIAEQDGRFISPIIKFKTCLKELDDLLRRALRDTEPDCPLVVVMEATNIVWYPVTAYFERRGATVYVVNPRMSSDLSRTIAAIYHDQMIHKGQHHCQAVCACATHLIDRVRVVLTQDRPYELQDVDDLRRAGVVSRRHHHQRQAEHW